MHSFIKVIVILMVIKIVGCLTGLSQLRLRTHGSNSRILNYSVCIQGLTNIYVICYVPDINIYYSVQSVCLEQSKIACGFTREIFLSLEGLRFEDLQTVVSICLRWHIYIHHQSRCVYLQHSAGSTLPKGIWFHTHLYICKCSCLKAIKDIRTHLFFCE